MQNITMCNNEQCPKADNCWRMGCPPDANHQSYAEFIPKQDDDEGFECDGYLEYPED